MKGRGGKWGGNWWGKRRCWEGEGKRTGVGRGRVRGEGWKRGGHQETGMGEKGLAKRTKLGLEQEGKRIQE